MDHQPDDYLSEPTRWAMPRRPADPAGGRGTGAEPPARRRSFRPAVAVGVTAVLAAAGAGVAFAAGSSTAGPKPVSASVAASSGSGTTSPSAPAGAAVPHRRGPRGRGGPMGGMAGVIHGSGTVRTSTGFKTLDFQIGTVSSVSSTSLTVKSADKYSQTYTVVASTVVDAQSGGISSVKAGDRVRVVAEPSSGGGNATATDVVDATLIGASHRSFGFGPPVGGATAPGVTPAPAA